MNSCECKVSDLTEKPEEKPEEKIVTPKNSSRELLETENIDTVQTQETNVIYNIDITSVKKIIVTLVVYLILNSETVRNILVNSFSFMQSQSGGLNLYGLIFTFIILAITYFIFS